jgi:hypothetical protein
MTRDPRLMDDQIEQMLRRRSAEPYAGMVRDVLDATSNVAQARRRPFEVNASRSTALVAAVLLLMALLIGTLVGGATRRWDGTPTPLRPAWMGAVRPDAAIMPTILMERNDSPNFPFTWIDQPDAVDVSIDVTTIHVGRRMWNLDLSMAQLPVPSDMAGLATEYGVVFDDGADGVPDCLVSVRDDDASRSSDFRVRVTNLVTGVTDERVGPPYGFPMEFSHPFASQSAAPYAMRFTFLGGTAPCTLSLGPVALYAWATLSGGEVVKAWDYAPDDAWLLPEEEW